VERSHWRPFLTPRRRHQQTTGFEKPSAIQQRGIVPFCRGYDVIQQAQSGTGKTATFCAGILHQARSCCQTGKAARACAAAAVRCTPLARVLTWWPPRTSFAARSWTTA
jgi:hypothetical protein